MKKNNAKNIAKIEKPILGLNIEKNSQENINVAINNIDIKRFIISNGLMNPNSKKSEKLWYTIGYFLRDLSFLKLRDKYEISKEAEKFYMEDLQKKTDDILGLLKKMNFSSKDEVGYFMGALTAYTVNERIYMMQLFVTALNLYLIGGTNEQILTAKGFYEEQNEDIFADSTLPGLLAI